MEFYDFKVMRGATFSVTLRFRQDGQIIDLTGYTAKSQVRVSPDGGELVAEMDTAITPEEGTVRLSIADEVTAGIASGAYVWDMRMTDPAGETRYYLGGKFSVIPSVTE